MLLIVTARKKGRQVAVFAGADRLSGVLHVAVRLLSGIGFAHLTLMVWLIGVGLSLSHQSIPLDTPHFLHP
ncbi:MULTISPECIES: hypothetical protein [Streptomyces]|uniref:hypothetical protein n=1 Tax=Streptomyces TaxID=1883 RepID=UPI0004CD25B5|nr:hypothetical protein [Streptomyces durhamensis]